MSRGTSPGSRRSEATLFPLPSVLVGSDHASERAVSPRKVREEIRQKRSARTETQEPILFPKLGIELADFPYLHCSRD
ncbi:hypothetical protein TNCT_483441 [Trichonephila clavata]|uniref:Uncharacterized protein n=1 Tax=Trichonephila clavata TaxID=2740835 RepID=A0A8X6EZN0_TRICU|nr:hypothetical protein TNCT_483441 [Trichonephila clavata]